MISILKPAKLAGTRWIGHRERALKILINGWKGFVVHTTQVAQGSTVSRDRAKHLNSTLTNLKFFLFARACNEFFTTIDSLSKALQYESISVDGVLRKLSATKERLDSMAASVGVSIAKDAQSLGGSLIYEGEQLKVPRGFASSEAVVTCVTDLMQQLLSHTVSAINARFSSFESHEVLKASSVFSPSTWPSDSSVLARFGYEQIRLLSDHFSRPLQHRGYEPELCVDEWPELKLKVVRMISLEPSLEYLTLWKRILSEGPMQSSLKNILALVKIILVIPVQTATIERGFSLMQRVKNDWRSRLNPDTLSQLLMIRLNGPVIEQFNPEAAVMRWWTAGPRRRRPSTTPYGPRAYQESDSDNE